MRVLNFGSLNLDLVYQVAHFVQPGETLSSDSLKTFCGGKGLNQSIALARAGCTVYHAGRVGPDGGPLLEKLSSAGVDVRHVETISAPTGHAMIQVDPQGQNGILLYGGANRSIEEAFIDRVLPSFGEGDLLVLQNEISSMPYLMERAAARGMVLCLNPSPIDEALAAYPIHLVRYLLLNEIEGERLTGEKDPDRIMDRLLQRSETFRVVLTLGRKGVLYGDISRRIHHGIFPVPVVDTTAAGDTFTGFFLGAIGRGLGMDTCLAYASAASSLAVSRAGASDSIPTWEETEKFLQANLPVRERP